MSKAVVAVAFWLSLLVCAVNDNHGVAAAGAISNPLLLANAAINRKAVKKDLLKSGLVSKPWCFHSPANQPASPNATSEAKENAGSPL
jgi:hypothetical protein